MFHIDCPLLDRQILVHDKDIADRTFTRHGTVVAFRCPCGGSGVRLNKPGSVSGHLVHHSGQSLAA